MTLSNSTRLDSLKIPFLPRLLEERFGLLYWRSGQPTRELPLTVGDLAHDLKIDSKEIGIRLKNLSNETRDIFIDKALFFQLEECASTKILDVSPHGATSPKISKKSIQLGDVHFAALLPELKKAEKVMTTSSDEGRSVSAALYLRSLGIKAFSLRTTDGIHNG